MLREMRSGSGSALLDIFSAEVLCREHCVMVDKRGKRTLLT